MPMIPEGGNYKSNTNGSLGQAVSPGTLGAAVNPRPYPTATIKARAGGSYSAPRSGGGISSVPSGGQGPIQPVVPDINAFLGGDAGYQSQLRDFANALAQFNADVTRRRGDLEGDYQTSQKAMNDQKIRDLENMQADYGARGVLRSGLYGKAVGDYNTEFGNRMTDLTTKEKQALGMLDQEKGRFGSQQQLQQQSAREAAIARRAQQFGV